VRLHRTHRVISLTTYTRARFCWLYNGTATDGGSYTQLAAGGAGHDLMLAEEGGNSILELSRLGGSSTPPVWVADVDKVEACVQDIERAMKELQGMHAQRVGSVFGKDLEDMERWIEQRTANVTDQFRYAERLLQKVGMATKRAGGQEATVGANVQRRCVC
jgi:hypothetical protein